VELCRRGDDVRGACTPLADPGVVAASRPERLTAALDLAVARGGEEADAGAAPCRVHLAPALPGGSIRLAGAEARRIVEARAAAAASPEPPPDDA
jgi:hypothetical protein